MSSEVKHFCDFCKAEIVCAAKAGARGYCGQRYGFDDDKYMEWYLDPHQKMSGPHICEGCVNSLLNSEAFATIGLS